MNKIEMYWKIYKEYKYNNNFYTLMIVSLFSLTFIPLFIFKNKEMALLLFLILFFIFWKIIPDIKRVEDYLSKQIIKEELK